MRVIKFCATNYDLIHKSLFNSRAYTQLRVYYSLHNLLNNPLIDEFYTMLPKTQQKNFIEEIKAAIENPRFDSIYMEKAIKKSKMLKNDFSKIYDLSKLMVFYNLQV